MPPCSVCQDLTKSKALCDGAPLATLLAVAPETCATCHLVGRAVAAIQDAHDSMVVGWDTSRIRGLRLLVGWPDGQHLFGVDMVEGVGVDNVQAAAGPVPWASAEHAETATDISADTSSEAALSTITKWIGTCTTSHACQSSKSPLPTRVLDVRSLEHLRLHCSQPGEEGPYACLSHCWGTAQTCKTTSLNMPQHRAGIPLRRLPRTFRDAVVVTHSLGIPYLWIDSLCIVQDSKEDWRIESAKMAAIYANSLVTLAASFAAGDDQGLFGPSPPSHKFVPVATPAYAVRVRKTLPHGHGARPPPLLDRAWVLQERLLSPRVVHFLPEELVWECMEQTTCECGCIRFLWSPGHEPFDKDLLHGPILARMSRADLAAQWHRLVKEYSRLDLTYWHDRLPAVSGAARRFSPFFGCQYLAGCWRDGLIRDLMWERLGPIDGARRLEGIPTWSWASLTAQVTFEEAMAENELAVVAEVACELVGSDEFGQVHGGTVCLSGKLLHAKLCPDPKQLVIEDTYLECVLDCEEGLEGQVTCLRVALRRGVYRSGQDEEVWLVLRPTEHMYRRVGLLKVGIGELETDDEGAVCIA